MLQVLFVGKSKGNEYVGIQENILGIMIIIFFRIMDCENMGLQFTIGKPDAFLRELLDGLTNGGSVNGSSLAKLCGWRVTVLWNPKGDGGEGSRFMIINGIDTAASCDGGGMEGLEQIM